jgi:hypothetical protein
MILTLALLAILPQADAPTKQEQELAAKLRKAVVAGDSDALKECVDFEGLLNRASAGAGSEALRKGFLAGASGLDRQLSAQLKKLVDEGGTYVLLRHRKVDGKQRPLFRFVSANGLNYHEFLPAEGGGRYVDFHVAISGEWMSETMRRFYLAAVAAASGKLEGREADLMTSMPRIQEMHAAAREERHEEVLKIWAGLPRSVQEEKFLLILRAQSASKVSEKEHLAALDAFEKVHPKDPAVALHRIDALFLRKKHDDLLKTIDGLDAALGGDPYLEILRGNAHWEADRRDKAKAAADRAIKAEPTLKDAYWTRITYALGDREHKVVAELLTALEKKLGEEIADLTEVESYAEFVKSPEYAEWMKKRGK